MEDVLLVPVHQEHTYHPKAFALLVTKIAWNVLDLWLMNAWPVTRIRCGNYLIHKAKCASICAL